MPSTLEEDLKQRLSEFNAAPFLFVGSGLSRRYYDLPDWKTLLMELSSMINVQYEEISSLEGGDLPRIATRLSSLMHPIWFHDDSFLQSRSTYSRFIKTTDDIIKIEAAKLIASKNVFSSEYEEEIYELRNVVIDGIITTNYDLMLERVFSDSMYAFVGQESMLKSPIHKIDEIYKIHGSVTQPTSLVLTSDDYQRFNDKNYYLSAILTQIFIEHPVIFIGYSISDPNIQKILSSIVNILDSELLERLSNRLIFIERGSNKAISNMLPTLMIFSNGKIQLPVTKITTDNFSEVFRPLQSFKREIPAKYLRIFKDTAYKIALHHSPESKLLLADLDDTSHDNNEFVFGHGVMGRSGLKGVFGLDRHDIVRDLLEIDSSYSTEEIFGAITKLSKQPGIIPLGKYFIQTGRAKFKNGRWEIEVPHQFSQNQRTRVLTYFRNDTKDYYAYRASDRTVETFNANFSNINQIVNEYGASIETIKRVGWLPFKQIDLNALQDLLIETEKLDKGNYATAYYKLVTLYDFLKYIYRGPKRPKKAVLVN